MMQNDMKCCQHNKYNQIINIVDISSSRHSWHYPRRGRKNEQYSEDPAIANNSVTHIVQGIFICKHCM